MGYYKAIQCDQCGTTENFRHDASFEVIRKWGRENGWSFGKTIKCPRCKKMGVN